MAGLAQGFVTQLRECRTDLQAAEATEREPHDTAIVEIRKRYLDPREMIDIALTRIGELLTPYLSAKEDRLRAAALKAQEDAAQAKRVAATLTSFAEGEQSVEAELAARRATEEAERLEKLAAKPAERAQVKGDLSVRAMSLRENWKAEITDRKAALRHYGKDEDVLAAAAAKALQKAGVLAREKKRADAAPPGFRFFKTEKAV